MNRMHVILSLGLIAIGLVLTFDALSSHELEWPLGVFALVVGIIWVVGRVGWWIVWKDSTKRSGAVTGGSDPTGRSRWPRRVEERQTLEAGRPQGKP